MTRQETAPGQITELRCNLDDMSPEALSYAQEILMREGARDVFLTPVTMKKNRQGALLTCVCAVEDARRMAHLILKHTTTWGVRETLCRKHTLSHTTRAIRTKYGDIRVKEAEIDGAVKRKFEHDDLARAAREFDLPLDAVLAEAESAIQRENKA